MPAKNRVPGIAIALIEGDNIAYLEGYGVADCSMRPVTPQTPFLLGSTSKSFTALAVLQLFEQGKLDLDVRVRKYLPWFSMRGGAGGTNASDRITLRQLLHHTSGIPIPPEKQLWSATIAPQMPWVVKFRVAKTDRQGQDPRRHVAPAGPARRSFVRYFCNLAGKGYL